MPKPALLTVTAFLSGLLAVSCKEEPPPPPPEDPCPHVGIETLQGDWIKVQGNRGDHRNRMRIKGEPGSYEAILVPGFFSKIEMTGRKRDTDYLFEQRLEGKMLDQFRTGYRTKYRMYVEPYKRSCSLRVVIAQISMNEAGKEKEKPRTSGFEEFLAFPEDVEFTFEVPTGFLFLGPAAKNRATAESQLARFEDYPKPDFRLGEAIPVGVFTEASADGAESCSYSMDLYFDDKPYTGRRDAPSEAAGKNLAAGPVKNSYRHWYVPDWFAPFSGNHVFEMYRFRSCGGERELIEIHGLEAVLN